MATNNNPSSQPLIPMFKGEKYHLLSLKMKTLFKSHELWDLVETGYEEPNPAPAQPSQQLPETRKKEASALFLIQSAMDDAISPRIAAPTTSHGAWETLKKEFLGERKVITIKLQSLRPEFETLAMKSKEPVQEHLSRVSGIVSHMSTYGESLNNEIIISEVV